MVESIFSFWILVFWMLVGHFLADFPLQGDYLAQLKNSRSPIGRDLWKWGLFGHAMIHAGMVALVTGFVFFGVLELIAHAIIDRLKTQDRISFMTDQWLHVACKCVWAFTVIWIM